MLHKKNLKNLKDLKNLKNENSSLKIVFVCGIFNVVHPGHLRLLRFAAESGDLLVVAVLCDRLARHAQIKQDARLDGVEAISWVDYAFILDDKPENFIKEIQPDIVVKGGEHEAKENPELEIIASYGGKLIFSSGDIKFSSLDLLKNDLQEINHKFINRPLDYLKNHHIDLEKIIRDIDKISNLKIVVIGDTIIDEYIQCDPLGLSQEDPTVVITPIISNQFLGGAGIVSAHAKSLGATSVSFLTVLGKDSAGRFAKKKLKEYGVNAKIIIDDSRPTTLKKRFRVGAKTMLRVSQLRQHKISKYFQAEIFKQAEQELKGANLVIFSDFNYGVLPQELVERISEKCKKEKIMMVADSQSSSQSGDITRYKKMELITPTEREARLALDSYEDGLVVMAEKLRNKAQVKNILITLGSEGMLIHAKDKLAKGWVTDRLPALNMAPKDNAGAGDSLLVLSSMCLALGMTIWESAYLGALAAACQVGRVGNIPLSKDEIILELTKN